VHPFGGGQTTLHSGAKSTKAELDPADAPGLGAKGLGLSWLLGATTYQSAAWFVFNLELGLSSPDAVSDS
jgi:hypothetical protein